MAEIKLSTITQLSRTRPHTIPYLLKAASDLTGGDVPAGRGNHRVFTPDQAFQIALAAILMDVGFNVEQSRQILRFCEAIMRQVDGYFGKLARSGIKDPHFREDPNCDFRLWVADGRYIAAHRKLPDTDHAQLTWYPLPPTSAVPRIDRPLTLLRVELTALRQRFLAEAAT